MTPLLQNGEGGGARIDEPVERADAHSALPGPLAITGRVSAFVPEHCGKRAWASTRSDADFGSGAGSADHRPAATGRLAISLPWGP